MKNTSFIRKIIYLVIMAGLLVPLYLISAPSFVRGASRSEGGKLTQLRDQYGLAQANLGEIDPASESMKLATLGMRGIAANLLWERANEYKKREEWDNLRATLNQIAKLQPNFISVWQFQAWNLSYNVSVEFDNYEHRYHWVKKGIEFLLQGTRYNHNEPRLLWDLGWFFGHKFGRSDEYVQFRRAYNDDEDFHESLDGQIDVEQARNHKGKPDNWLTAYQWFNEAQRVVDLEGVPIKGKNPLVFHSDSAKSLIRYADALENEGTFGEIAKLAWERAYNRWLRYGDREIPTSYGYKIRLNEGEKMNTMVEQREQALEDLVPGLRARIEQERMDSLTDEERRLLAADRASLEPGDYDLAVSAETKVSVTPEDVIERIDDPTVRRQARLLANRIFESKAYATTIRRYRDVVNFLYWRTRCEVEREDRAIEARKYLHDAQELYDKEVDLIGAAKLYDEAWKRWATIHRNHPILAEDVTAEDLVDQIKEYRQILSQMDRDFPPPNFPMLRLVANYAEDFGFSKDEADEMLQQAERIESQLLEEQTNETSQADEAESQSSTTGDSAPTAAEVAEVAEVAASAEPDTAEEEPGTAHQVEASWTSARIELEAAEALYLEADMEAARLKYSEALAALQDVPVSELEDAEKQELIKFVRQYRILLGQLDRAFPPPEFPLSSFVKQFASDFGYSDAEAERLFAD